LLNVQIDQNANHIKSNGVKTFGQTAHLKASWFWWTAFTWLL